MWIIKGDPWQSCLYGNVQGWNATSAEQLQNAIQNEAPVFSLATSSRFLAMGLTDTIQIIGEDLDGGIPPLEASGENVRLVFNEDGSLLASADSGGGITIWQYQDGKFNSVATFDKERATSLAFQAKGTLLAVGTARYVYLMDTDGTELARIPHTDTVNAVSFSADGKYLATASSTLLQLWDLGKIQLVKSEELIPAACARLFENFSAAQWETFFKGEKYELLCQDLPQPK